MRLVIKNTAGLTICIGLFLTCGCGDRKPPNPYLNNMADFSYSGQITDSGTMTRVNANGRPTAVTEFKGRFVWADYSAPWCGPCVSQAGVIKKLERKHKDRVVFFTVLTSASREYHHVPGQMEARSWAKRFGFNKEHVVAATNLWGWKIPTHILYSPEGQTMHRSFGFLTSDQINDILAEQTRVYNEWSKTNSLADWMEPEE